MMEAGLEPKVVQPIANSFLVFPSLADRCRRQAQVCSKQWFLVDTA